MMTRMLSAPIESAMWWQRRRSTVHPRSWSIAERRPPTMSFQARASTSEGVLQPAPAQVIGRSTVACLQSGIMYAAWDAMDGMIRRLKREIGRNALVIATGGYAQLIAAQSRLIDHIDPDLVLEGAHLIFERVKRSR